MLSVSDVQQLLLQSITVEKINQTQQQHPDAQQKYLAMQLTEERKLLQKKINSAEEAERALIRDKEEQQRRKKMALAPSEPGDGKGQEGTVSPFLEEQGEYIDVQV
ncbi:MAG: hypothetical protein ACYDAA_15885 [Syntrophales bacterium]